MKSSPILSLIASAGLLAAMTGCGDNASQEPQDTNPPAAPAGSASSGASADGGLAATTAAISETAAAARAEAEQKAAAVATEVKGAAQAVSEAVTEAGAAAQEAFSSLAADVKRLLDEGKAAEAAQRIQNAISQLKLTPEQRQRVEELMAQAQDLIKKKGAEAANAVSGFLKKDGK